MRKSSRMLAMMINTKWAKAASVLVVELLDKVEVSCCWLLLLLSKMATTKLDDCRME